MPSGVRTVEGTLFRNPSPLTITGPVVERVMRPSSLVVDPDLQITYERTRLFAVRYRLDSAPSISIESERILHEMQARIRTALVGASWGDIQLPKPEDSMFGLWESNNEGLLHRDGSSINYDDVSATRREARGDVLAQLGGNESGAYRIGMQVVRVDYPTMGSDGDMILEIMEAQAMIFRRVGVEGSDDKTAVSLDQVPADVQELVKAAYRVGILSFTADRQLITAPPTREFVAATENV